MPPHNSPHAVSFTLYGTSPFQKQSPVLKDHVFVLKMKVAQKTGDGEEMTAKPFPCSSIKKKKGEMS